MSIFALANSRSSCSDFCCSWILDWVYKSSFFWILWRRLIDSENSNCYRCTIMVNYLYTSTSFISFRWLLWNSALFISAMPSSFSFLWYDDTGEKLICSAERTMTSVAVTWWFDFMTLSDLVSIYSLCLMLTVYGCTSLSGGSWSCFCSGVCCPYFLGMTWSWSMGNVDTSRGSSKIAFRPFENCLFVGLGLL